MQGHFFNLLNRRTTQDVAEALRARGIPVEGNYGKIAGFLARRVKSGTLKTSKSGDERIYWAD